VSKLPVAVLIDEEGVVRRAKGGWWNTPEHWREYRRGAKADGIAVDSGEYEDTGRA